MLIIHIYLYTHGIYRFIHSIDMRKIYQYEVNSNNDIIILLGKDPLASTLTIPINFGLSQAYPNPFNPTTSLNLALSENGFTYIVVYNLVGQVIDIINEGNMTAGYHHINWEANNFTSGIYLLKVEQGKDSAIQKLILIK